MRPGARFALMLALLMALLHVPVAGLHAVEPDEVLQDPALEARARRISAGLRCLVCQNESIDASHAPLAKDLRLLVRERLVAGDSDDAVLDFVVARYGKFVLLRPPLAPETLLLWGTPIIVLAGVGLALLMHFRQQRAERASAAASEPLSAHERERLDNLLKDSD